MFPVRIFILLATLLLLSACSGGPWNNPYPEEDAHKNIYYSSFDERPKHLDPARSYSANEWAFISQIYEDDQGLIPYRGSGIERQDRLE